VDWYPWGDEAFRRAREEDRPVFLSIGYATCHWCHVMAEESFEDPAIAGILNSHFVSVKVDREERPDIDSIYMSACQRMTGQGGWPLTIIMTPDKKPFFAGTYLPRTSRAGMPGLTEVLQKAVRLWREQRATLMEAAEQVTAVLRETPGIPAGETAGRSLLVSGFEELACSFDPVYGGFGSAPKFPTPSKILFLLRYWKRTGSDRALRMAEETLEAMRCGGIHDHLGGGFHRYSTDRQWLVPHFEKMLCDQALLLMAYTEAWLATKRPVYRKTAESIISYVNRDLSSPEGAFVSAEDADSPAGEGAFYLWTREELDSVLGSRDGAYAAGIFHVRSEGNFPVTGTGTGKNILYRKRVGGADTDDPVRTEPVRKRLLAAREKRPRPQRDGKILTDWNGLMAAALARSSRAFGNPDHYHAGAAAMRFVLGNLRSSDGGLLHRWCDGEAAVAAFADDYASVIRALVDLYQAGFDPAWLEEALALGRYLTEHFYDKDGDGFFTTPDNGERLIARRKEFYDGAVPSANSLMFQNLVMLGHLTGDPLHEERAARLADMSAGIVRQSPGSYTAYLSALDHLLGPASDVVIAGERTDPEAEAMIRIVSGSFFPSVTVHFRSRAMSPALDAVAPFTRTMTGRNGKPAAYVCTGRTCSPAVTDAGELRKLLSKK